MKDTYVIPLTISLLALIIDSSFAQAWPSCRLSVSPGLFTDAPSRTNKILPFVNAPAASVDLFALYQSFNISDSGPLSGYAAREIGTDKISFVMTSRSKAFLFDEKGLHQLDAKSPALLLDNGGLFANLTVVGQAELVDPQHAIDDHRTIINGQIVDRQWLAELDAKRMKTDSLPTGDPSAHVESIAREKLGAEASHFLHQHGRELAKIEAEQPQAIEAYLETLERGKDEKTGESVMVMYVRSQGLITGAVIFRDHQSPISSNDRLSLVPGEQIISLSGKRQLTISTTFADRTVGHTVSHTVKAPALGKALGVRDRTYSGTFYSGSGLSVVHVDMALRDPVAEAKTKREEAQAKQKQLDEAAAARAVVAKAAGIEPALFDQMIDNHVFYETRSSGDFTPSLEDLRNAKIQRLDTKLPAEARHAIAIRMTFHYAGGDTVRTAIVDTQTGRQISYQNGNLQVLTHAGSTTALMISKDSLKEVDLKKGLDDGASYSQYGDIRSAAFSPNGKLLLVRAEKADSVVDASTLAEVKVIRPGLFGWGDVSLQRSEWASNGDLVVTNIKTASSKSYKFQ